MSSKNKSKQKRDKGMKAAIATDSLRAQWAAPLESISPSLKPIAGHPTGRLVASLVSLLTQLITAADVGWDRQSRVLKQLEALLNQATKLPFLGSDSAIDATLVHLLTEVLVPVLVRCLFLAGDVVPRRHCVAVLTACERLLGALELNLATTPLLETVSARIQQDLLASLNDCNDQGNLESLTLSEREFPSLPATRRPEVIHTLCEFAAGQHAVEAVFVETLTSVIGDCIRVAASLNLNVMSHSTGDTETFSPIPVLTGQLDYLRSLTRTLQVILTTHPGSYRRLGATPVSDTIRKSLANLLMLQPSHPEHPEGTVARAVHCLCQALVGNCHIYTLDVSQAAGLVMGLAQHIQGPQVTPDSTIELSFEELGRVNNTTDPSIACLQKRMANLCTIRGCLVYTETKTLVSMSLLIDGPHSAKPAHRPLLQVLFTYLQFAHGISSDFQDRVLVFESLALWIQRIKDGLVMLAADSSITGSASQISPAEKEVFSSFATDSAVLESMLKHVWNHWDDPVDAIRHKVNTIFDTIMDICELPDFQGAMSAPFTHQLLDRILGMRWDQRAKYPLLSSIACRIGNVDIFSRQPRILVYSLEMISDNLLRPRVVELHLTMLKRGSSDYGCNGDLPSLSRAQWLNMWAEAYRESLRSSNPATRKSVAALVLPTLLRLFPDALPLIVGPLQTCTMNSASSEFNLHALLAIHKTTKALGWPEPDVKSPTSPSRTLSAMAAAPVGLTEEQFQAALHHQDNNVRLDLVGLLCEARKATQPITSLELTWLRALILANLNNTSSDFRQKFQGTLHRFLIRLRGNCYQWERERIQQRRWADKLLDSVVRSHP
ncbi:hypothetical protein BJ085DRAFT_31590 [Dimargaris cristalligena]|uniref:tRNA (32-2'-O)-methyltransferase regulator THADA-like TPR repeats region domain-containing protein n=1 Tax=Dimargaris cristalligena TaxID=215637 RepID=A0A4P9ZKA8_9FUNG|nr:hypothetical protein BJ085DRAFT_31590 [Dimargaris cristalligena]|eukprot:RKP33478.1 hypothetical protein BJ085DRAFT_31590 [Dimargaris cristalligena]